MSTIAQQAKILSSIAREGDWVDFLRYSPQESLFRMRRQLEGLLRGAGDTRTPKTDLARLRLSQLRRFLAAG